MRRRVVVTGIGCVTPLGTRDRDRLETAAGRRVGRGLHHPLRRQQLPHQDLRRGPRLGPLRRRRGPRGLEAPGPPHPLRRRRRQEGRGRLGPRPRPRSTPPGSASTPAAAKGSRTSTASPQMMVAALAGGDSSTSAAFTRKGLEILAPDRRVGAGAEHAGRPPGQPVRRRGAERQLPDGLRRQQPGDRRGGRDHPPRRGRRDALRRHAHDDPPLRRDRLQPADGPEHPQRRARPRPRARSTATATASCSAKGPAWSCSKSSSTPRPAARRSTARSSATAPRPTPSASPTPIPKAAAPSAACSMALDDAGVNLGRRRLHQRPRHQHHGQRPGRDAGHQAGLRRAGLQDPRLQHQEHDGPPDRRGRGHGADHLPAGHPRQRGAADDQLRDARPRLRPGLRSQRRPRGTAATWR